MKSAKRVRCRSGVTGWQCRLQDNYNDFEDFLRWTDLYAIHSRLGYETAADAWEANPIIQGSVVPSDLCKVGGRRRSRESARAHSTS